MAFQSLCLPLTTYKSFENATEGALQIQTKPTGKKKGNKIHLNLNFFFIILNFRG